MSGGSLTALPTPWELSIMRGPKSATCNFHPSLNVTETVTQLGAPACSFTKPRMGLFAPVGFHTMKERVFAWSGCVPQSKTALRLNWPQLTRSDTRPHFCLWILREFRGEASGWRLRGDSAGTLSLVGWRTAEPNPALHRTAAPLRLRIIRNPVKAAVGKLVVPTSSPPNTPPVHRWWP